MFRFLILFLLIAGYLNASPNEESVCKKAVLIYLDVSGSMYSNSGAYKNDVVIQGKNYKLMDAMINYIGNVLSYNPNNNFLMPGDKVEITGFYSETAPLIKGIEEFTPEDAESYSGLHSMLDINNDGILNSTDFSNKFSNQSKTDFIPVLKSIEKKIKEIIYSNKFYYSTAVLIFSDGNHEYNMDELEEEIKTISENYNFAINESKPRFFFIELNRTNVSQYFEKYLDASRYSVNSERNFEEQLKEIDKLVYASFEDFPIFLSVEPDELFIDTEEKATQVKFKLFGDNRSCFPQYITKIGLNIYRNDSLIASDNYPSEQKVIDAQKDFETEFNYKFDISDEGEYRIDFYPITRNQQKYPSTFATATIYAGTSGIDIGLMLLILLFLIIFALVGIYLFTQK